jgi:hypothetical protein
MYIVEALFVIAKMETTEITTTGNWLNKLWYSIQ